MAKKGWTWGPGRGEKPKLTDGFKAEVSTKAAKLVNEFLKPNFIAEPPKEPRWNYIIEIHKKWHGSYLYFIATYRSPHPNAITPTFEAPFARMEYVGNKKFNMAYMRHNEKWQEIRMEQTLDECLKEIRNESIFQPARP
jgi:hypothetical protein